MPDRLQGGYSHTHLMSDRAVEVVVLVLLSLLILLLLLLSTHTHTHTLPYAAEEDEPLPRVVDEPDLYKTPLTFSCHNKLEEVTD